MSSSLSSVVSNLVRASMGSISNMVTDDDLDRHVAELIVKEAKKKAERYGQQGIRAYLSSNLYVYAEQRFQGIINIQVIRAESNAPRTNKRFLTSIIKSTDDHNKTVLKAQAAAAQEVKREREEQERRERRARAAEAAEAEKLRRRSKRKRDSEDEYWDRWDGRTADRKRTSSSMNWDNWTGYGDDDDDDRSKHRRRRTGDHLTKSRSRERKGDTSSGSSHTKHNSSLSKRHRTHRSSSASPPRKASRDENSHRQDDDSRTSHRHQNRHKRPRSSSRSPSPQRRRKRRRTPKYALDDLRDESLSPRSCSTALGSERQPRDRRSSTPWTPRWDHETSSKDDTIPIPSASRHSSPSSRVPSRPSSPSPGPQPPMQLPSKMDRYFEESYDPRLDVAPLSAPKVPASGLINNAEFEGWDAMLELIRVRREDKEEKKRLDRLGLSKEKVKAKKNVPINSSAAVADRWSSEGVSILDIEYKKRGSVREWDVGKEGL